MQVLTQEKIHIDVSLTFVVVSVTSTTIEGLDKLKTLLYNDTEYIIGIWHSKLHGI